MQPVSFTPPRGGSNVDVSIGLILDTLTVGRDTREPTLLKRPDDAAEIGGARGSARHAQPAGPEGPLVALEVVPLVLGPQHALDVREDVLDGREVGRL